MLICTGVHWSFENERALESIVAGHLPDLLSLKLLHRQYLCQGEICDLVATNADRQLVIVELKNNEDRYIVQQLTRYYESLTLERPWSDQIDYTQPARLLAIAPSFHRHNFIDRKYNRLKLEFFTFQVIQQQDGFWLQLSSVDTHDTTSIPLNYTEVTFPLADGLPAPPQRLLEALGAMPPDVQQNILALRDRVLRFDPRIQEVETAQSIGYGRGQKNWCVELSFDRKQSDPILFLWLPLLSYRHKKAIGRHRIWTDWTTVLYWVHVPSGLGQAKPMEEWQQIPPEKHPRKYLTGGKFKYVADRFSPNVALHFGCTEQTALLQAIVDAALQQWQARL